jgi:hypothetical protein
MKGIVKVRLGVDPTTGLVDPRAPFLVIAPQPGRSGMYHDEPDVIAQIAPDEVKARFEAEWIEGEWKFGKRVLDA